MESDRKNRTRRLIQIGALAEKYLQCEGCSPDEFETKLKGFISPPMMDSRTINSFLRDLSCLAGTGNGIGPATVERLKTLAIMFGYLSDTPQKGRGGS